MKRPRIERLEHLTEKLESKQFLLKRHRRAERPVATRNPKNRSNSVTSYSATHPVHSPLNC